jgi:Transglutaminase-like superfamily
MNARNAISMQTMTSLIPVAARATPSYLLPFHIRFCLVAEGAIFLDLRHDKYFALDPVQTSALGTLAAEWPVDRAVDVLKQSGGETAGTDIGDALVKAGLLTRSPTEGRLLAPQTPLPAHEELWPFDTRGTSPVRLSSLRPYMKAYVRVSLSLRFGTLEHVAQRVATRKAHASEEQRELQLEKTKELLAVYRVLQAFTFTAKRACLFDSLLLIDFLAQHGLYPDLMVGVCTGPFVSHCWVQQDEFILNGTTQYVRRFTPILVI